MKLRYALVDEKDNIIGTYHSVEFLKQEHEKLKNRRTGKTHRAIFTALSITHDVVLISNTRETSLYAHQVLVKQIFDSLGYEYKINKSNRCIEYYGRNIYFRVLGEDLDIFQNKELKVYDID